MYPLKLYCRRKLSTVFKFVNKNKANFKLHNSYHVRRGRSINTHGFIIGHPMNVPQKTIVPHPSILFHARVPNGVHRYVPTREFANALANHGNNVARQSRVNMVPIERRRADVQTIVVVFSRTWTTTSEMSSLT